MTEIEAAQVIEDKKVCIIYTGGTIRMSRTDSGYAPVAGHLQQELDRIDDLRSTGMPQYELVEFTPLLDSSNITYVQWNMIAESIASRYDDYDGFVVLHGTDTMAYSASALSFMFENLNKPVIFTGSQIPLCELRSDGKDNLITSILIAVSDKINEVALYFGHRLLRGNRSMKASADGLIAFSSPNYPPLAEAGIDINYNAPRLMPKPRGELLVQSIKPAKVGVIKLFPGIRFELFAPIVTHELDALVLETFGTGNIPNYDEALPPLIARAISNGTAVVVCTQCAQGTVRLGAYETSSELANAGAVSGSNMTTEATVAKLYYLFSLGLERSEVSKLIETDLRGELDH
ncbi:asparaginase [Mogibacterium timidum]